MRAPIPAMLCLALFCAACHYPTQTRYNYAEVGQVQLVQFGQVVAVRDIDIMGPASKAGAIAGAGAGAEYGLHAGAGSPGVMIMGAGLGMLGAMELERAIRSRGGVEYTVALRNGKVLTVAQNISDKDILLKIGDRVIVQMNGDYQRVLPANDMPTEIEKPKGIELK